MRGSRVVTGPAKRPDVARIARLATRCRLVLLEMIHRAGSGHAGSSLSCTDIISVLKFDQMDWSADRSVGDVFVLSKGHAAPAWYAALVSDGDLPRALARRLHGRDSTVYCLLGDGECQEGQVWEAFLYAGAHRVSGLVAIIDHNGSQSDGAVDDIVPLCPLPDKMRAFGWHVDEVDGHDHGELRDALRRHEPDRPSAIIAHTRKGRLGPGRVLLDGSHSDLPSAAEYAAAVVFLETLLEGGA